MKLYTSVSIVLATTVVANSQTVMLDQIGPMDGTGIGTAIIGNQDMESANDIYDLVAADNFSSGGETISTLEMVLNGWNGFVDPSSITGYTSNIFTSEANLAVSIIGDIASEYIDAANATISPDWLGGGFLVSVNTTMVSNLGSQLIALVPSNPFATGGQTGIADSLLGDGVFAWQGNPGGGFAMPNNMQQATTDVAYRITTNSLVDPCSYLLPVPCTVDVDGDSVVSVGDVLAIIANWGECGDGTFRPAGDVSPMPSGDCCVTVGDILAVVGAWGEDCSPRGACCSQSGVCTDTLTESECLALNGSYMSDDTLCSDSQCISGACCIDAVTCNDGLGMWYCNQLGGTFRGTGSLCASVDCDLICSAIGCQPADLGGHGVDGIIGSTSDTNVDAGYVSADTFSPTVSGSVSQVCWWGLYIDFSTSTDCGAVTPGTGDNFTITYYLDSADSTIPGALHAGPFAVT